LRKNVGKSQNLQSGKLRRNFGELLIKSPIDIDHKTKVRGSIISLRKNK
jgi:hypothetical protein